MTWFKFFLFLSVTIVGLSQAQSKVKVFEISKSKAPVYRKPSFDAAVIIRLKKGQKLYGSDKEIEGSDGFGIFYKVRLKKGLYGYVLDTSTKGFTPKGRLKSSGSIYGNIKEIQKSGRQVDPWQKTSVIYTKSYGLALQMFPKYSIEFKDRKKSSQEWTFGLSLSGPGWIFSSFPLDINLLFSPSSPSLFDSFTQGHSGYFGFLELGVPFELKKGRSWSIFAELAAVVSHHSYKLKINNENLKSSSTDLGLNGGLGVGYRWRRYLFKLDAKYYKVKEDHVGLGLRVQRIF